jgi:hypothetical protein
LIDRGVELRRKRDHAGALEVFGRAHMLAPSALTLAQMGLAEEPLRRWEDSEVHLMAALADRSAPWIQQHRQQIETELSKVRGHFGELVVSGTPRGARVNINGRERGVLPLPQTVRVGEGSVQVQITAGGHQPYSATVVVSAGGRNRLNVALEPVKIVEVYPDAAGRSPGQRGRAESETTRDGGVIQRREGRPSPAESSWKTPAGIALVGVGVVGTIVGAVLVLKGTGSACDQPTSPGFACNTTRSSRRWVGWGFLGGGLGLAATGGLVLYSGRRVQVAATLAPSQFLVLKGAL